MKQITIDCSQIESREALHTAFAEAFAFPGWYGRNLDALHDCLTDIRGQTALRLLHWNAAAEVLGSYARAAQCAMEDAARDNPNLILEFL